MGKEEEKLLLKTIDDFHEKYKSLKDKLPYSFNLLDEIKANENAHSKILTKLLAYNEGDEYPFLKSFVESVDFDTLSSKVKHPEFHTEKDRIDISIKDDDYAIIIENKIHNAPDRGEQGGQVNRYVEKVGAKYSQDKIFVLYLTRSGGIPSKESLSEKNKGELGDNYKAINYRGDILPWLKEFILPQCRIKHKILIAGIQQYIDHLEGVFKTRENMKEMNEQLKIELEEKLNLNKELSLENKVTKINEIEDGISAFLPYLEKTKVEYLSEISKMKFNEEYRSKWQNLLNELYPKYVISCEVDSKGYWWIGIEMKYNDSRFLCGIGYDNISEQKPKNLKPYFGITCRPATDIKKLDKNLKMFLQKEFHLKKSNATKNWYIHKQASFDDVFEKFKMYFNEVVQKHDNVVVIKKQ